MFGALLKLGCTLEFQTHIRERESADTQGGNKYITQTRNKCCTYGAN